MTKRQKYVLAFSALPTLALTMMLRVNAMHIIEGYLPLTHSVAWGAVCIPFLVAGIISIQKIVSQKRKTLLLFAMAGAYTFVLSALKIPSVTQSSSHPTGTGLGAILFGPAPMVVIGVIVLLFQALLLAHGGLTTLGANTFSMAIAGPFLTYGIYTACNALRVNKKVSIFLACTLGNLFTYCITSLQLAAAYPSVVGGVGASAVKFMSVFALTQIPIAIIEGLLTVVVVMGLESWAQPELRELGYLKGAK